MNRLVIIRGNSGSGKSTAAKKLQKRLGPNTLLISQDTVRREMLQVLDGPDTAALSLLMSLLRYGHENCEITILEGILNAEWYFPLFEEAARLFDNRIFAYYYDVTFEETLQRHQRRDKRREFGEEEMRCWWREKDYIGFIPERTVTEDMSLEETVCKILSEIQEPGTE